LIGLQHQTQLDVLHEQGDWLFVATTDGNAGYVHRDYVAMAVVTPQPTAPTPPLVVTTAGVAPRAQAGFLASMADLLNLPLAPSNPITLGGNAGPGARLLASIWNRYGGVLEAVANKLGIDPALTVAILAVESGGNAFGVDGRMIIRFENHLFYQYWGKQHPDQFAQFFTFNQGRSWEGHTWRPNTQQNFQEFHGNQAIEWRVLTFAASLDDTAAKSSISMGLPQIMGFNYQRIGYATVQDMFNAFQADERAHVLGLFDFIKADAAMLQAIRTNNYVSFASGYNGSGQAQYYGGLIDKWVKAFAVLRTAPESASFGLEEAPPTLTADLDAAISFLPLPLPPAIFMSVEPPTPAAAVAPVPAAAIEAAPEALELPVPQPSIHQPAPNPLMDERLYTLWLRHVEHGFENNNIMFNRVLKAFMVPYYMTIVMYAIMFAVGIGLFVIAARLSSQPGTQIVGAVFAGLGVASFLGYFLSRPLRSLEENLQFITWLGVVYNTYWTRLLYMQDATTVHADLKDATTDAVQQIEYMLNKNVEISGKRPNVRDDVQPGG
jgi:hypothetical protein